MMRITLVRHAKSSWKESGLRDFDRPLNSRGKKNALMMGIRLREADIVPDVIVSSPAKRAITTAKLIAKEIGFNKRDIVLIPEIYEANVDTLLAVIQSFEEGWEDVMLVGHNPGLTELAEVLSGNVFDNLVTCAVCGLDFLTNNWAAIGTLKGEIYYYDYPKSIIQE